MTEDEMVEWHHRLDGHEFEPASGGGKGQGSLACCSPWGHIVQDSFYITLLLLLFSRSVMSDSLRPHESQHARPPCSSSSPGVCPNSCPLHQRCHPAISSSGTLFSCHQSFPASGTFPMSRLLASDDQNTGASVLVSVLPTGIQG